MDTKKNAILERIKTLEEGLTKAREYLETGAYSDWNEFRPWFRPKFKNGKEMPPHKLWVKNVFIPRYEKDLHRAEKLLDKFE